MLSSIQQLQSSEREKEMYRQQLMSKEAELTEAEETIRREQLQMPQQVSDCVVIFSECCDWKSFSLQETERDEIVQAKDRELAQAQQQLRQLRQQVICIT